MRGEGFAVETICQVLREQGVQVAARTYRAWKTPGRILSARTVSDAVVVDAMIEVRTTADGRPTPESLYGRRKMTALLRRRGLPVAHCTVDRLMREQVMNGVRRGRAHRTTIPGKDGFRAGDLLNRDFTAPAPNRVWIADFERHEALLNLAVVKGHRSWLVAAGWGSRRTVTGVGMGLGGGAVLDNDEAYRHCQMVRARLARRTGIRIGTSGRKPLNPLHRLKPGGNGSGRIAHPGGVRPRVGELFGRVMSPSGGHGEGLRRSRGDGAGA